MAKIVLDIIVVGAGIAGLAAAISLSRAGHNVTVGNLRFPRENGMLSLVFRFSRDRP
jgi:2-polyprenyl-6-methoxyphenol hydroxylase-like FAD-dependent oxidoreductase